MMLDIQSQKRSFDEVTLEYSSTGDPTVDAIMRLVDTIDLSMVKLKIMDKEEGQGWDQEFADYAELRYRRYLCMVRLIPDGSVVPTKEIDLFWHQHILDTRAYAEDCQRVFGEFLHHFPYFGMRGEDDAANLHSAFEATKENYSRIFKEPYCPEEVRTIASRCHKGPVSTCHKCTSPSPTCHKCTSKPGPDTIKCTKCKSK